VGFTVFELTSDELTLVEQGEVKLREVQQVKMQVEGVEKIKDEATVPYIIIRLRVENHKECTCTETLLLRAGEGETYEKFCRSNYDGPSASLAGEGRIKHFKTKQTLYIYSTPGPSHKLCFEMLKEKFPNYHLKWQDG